MLQKVHDIYILISIGLTPIEAFSIIDVVDIEKVRSIIASRNRRLSLDEGR